MHSPSSVDPGSESQNRNHSGGGRRLFLISVGTIVAVLTAFAFIKAVITFDPPDNAGAIERQLELRDMIDKAYERNGRRRN